MSQKKTHYKHIGVYGMRHGAGVTHFCIMLANFMNDICLRKTAVLQFDESGDLAALSEKAGVTKTQLGFIRYGVEYVPYAGRVNKQQLDELAQRYDCIIDDLSCHMGNLSRASLCDCLIAVAASAPWNKGALECAAKQNPSYVLLNREPARFDDGVDTGTATQAVLPVETDLFCLSGRTVKFLKKLLKGADKRRV